MTLPRVPTQALAVVAMSLGFSLTSHGAEPIGQVPAPPALSPEATNALLAIDGVPNPTQLETLIPGQTLSNLLAIATYPGPETGNAARDAAQARLLIPIRLRAIRATSLFELVAPDPMILTRRAALTTLLHTSRLATASSSSVLIAQAVLESLGKIGVGQDLTMLTEITDTLELHPNRDVRLAATRALHEMGATTAVDALRRQLNKEDNPGVVLAIKAAIMALNQSPAPSIQ